MTNLIILNNDIKNYLNKIDQSLYCEIDDKDIQQIYDLLFKSQEEIKCTETGGNTAIGFDTPNLKSYNENNGIINYYHGVYCYIKKYSRQFTYYQKSVEQGNIGAMIQLIKLYKQNNDYVNEYVYRIILNNTQNTWSSLLECFKIGIGIGFFTNQEHLNVYKNLGDYYSNQHNYELMGKYYSSADIIQQRINTLPIGQLTTNIQNHLLYSSIKKYINDPELLNDVAKYYGVTNDNNVSNSISYIGQNTCIGNDNTLVGSNAIG